MMCRHRISGINTLLYTAHVLCSMRVLLTLIFSPSLCTLCMITLTVVERRNHRHSWAFQAEHMGTHRSSGQSDREERRCDTAHPARDADDVLHHLLLFFLLWPRSGQWGGGPKGGAWGRRGGWGGGRAAVVPHRDLGGALQDLGGSRHDSRPRGRWVAGWRERGSG